MLNKLDAELSFHQNALRAVSYTHLDVYKRQPFLPVTTTMYSPGLLTTGFLRLEVYPFGPLQLYFS